MPIEKGRGPAIRNIQYRTVSMQPHHGNHCNGYAGYGHDNILYYITQHNAVHAAQYGIEHSKQRKYNTIQMRHVFRRHGKWNISLNHIPWYKYFNELAQAHKAIGQKSKAA